MSFRKILDLWKSETRFLGSVGPFFVPQETQKQWFGLLRQGKNLVSLQMSGSEFHIQPAKDTARESHTGLEHTLATPIGWPVG